MDKIFQGCFQGEGLGQYENYTRCNFSSYAEVWSRKWKSYFEVDF